MDNEKKNFTKYKNLKLNLFKEIKNYSNEIKFKNKIDGYATSVIISDKNYPNLRLNSISNDKKENSFLNSSNLVKLDYEEIIKFKARNIFSSINNLNIKKFDENIFDTIRDIYSAKKEVEFSSKFEKELNFNKIIISKNLGLIGSKNELSSINPNENISISKYLDKFLNNDIKSKEAIISLYERGFKDSQIINLLSLGSFGISINKKLLPTKWAITTFDKTIEEYLFNKIKKYNLINDYQLFEYYDKGNLFLIFLFPNYLSGEIIELIKEKDYSNLFKIEINSDYFNNDNKLNKKSPESSGAYFAMKMAIFEYLNRIRKQAGVLVIRRIINYDLPLGVEFVRESIRMALDFNFKNSKNKFESFNSRLDLEEYLKLFDTEIYNLYLKSKFLKNILNSRSLNDFI